MASITTRAGKGSPLTNAELDANFVNINAELAVAAIIGGTIDGATIGATSPVTAVLTQLDVDNIQVSGNTILSTDTNGNINLSPNGTGVVAISAASITGGSISGITDLAVADGGTGASTIAGAQANLQVDPAGTAVALAIALG